MNHSSARWFLVGFGITIAISVAPRLAANAIRRHRAADEDARTDWFVPSDTTPATTP